MRTVPVLSAASTRAQASGTVVARGFSTSVCFPAAGEPAPCADEVRVLGHRGQSRVDRDGRDLRETAEDSKVLGPPVTDPHHRDAQRSRRTHDASSPAECPVTPGPRPWSVTPNVEQIPPRNSTLETFSTLLSPPFGKIKQFHPVHCVRHVE